MINKAKILDELNQSGIPLEIYTSNQLVKNRWAVRPSVDYYNERLSDYRETDIIAYKMATNLLGIVLIIECKKSSDPWVFVKQNRLKRLLSENLNIAIIRDDFVNYENLEKSMEYHHYYSEVPTCPYSFVAHVKQNTKKETQIYQAKIQVINSLIKMMSNEIKFYKLKKEVHVKQFYYPVIVFDGELCCAEIKNDEFEINEVNHLLYSIDRELPIRRELDFGKLGEYSQDFKPYMIDVVKKEYLDEYFEKVTKYFKEAGKYLDESFKD